MREGLQNNVALKKLPFPRSGGKGPGDGGFVSTPRNSALAKILHSLPYNEGFKANKWLDNSILSSEAKRYVWNDKKTYTYRIREADEATLDLPPWDLVRERIFQILKIYGRLSVSELKEELELDGMPVPKWMIKAILSKDDFRFAVSIADNTPDEQEPKLRERDRILEGLLGDF